MDGDGRTNAVSYVTASPYSTNLISQVTDPFGRQASFAYTAAGQLQTITDVLGLQSVFAYQANDFIAANFDERQMFAAAYALERSLGAEAHQ